MIKDFVADFDSNRSEIWARIDEADSPYAWTYGSLFRLLVEQIPQLDPDRITLIDDGDYQGTLVFVVGETGYQPFRYYASSLTYGSCDTCDALAAAHDSDDPTTALFNIALHLFQNLREIT